MSEKLKGVMGGLRQIATSMEMDALVHRLNRNTGVPSADQMRARGVSDEEYARLKRGEEQHPLIAYHGTPNSFDEFARGDIGFHVGTAEQAYGRIKGIAEGARIMPLRVNVRSPLTVKNDVGSWNRPPSVAEELLMTPQLRRSLSRNDMEYLERVYNERASDPFDLVSQHPNIYLDPQMQKMRDILREYGYDSIRYPNLVENLYRARPGDSPRLENVYKRLDEKADAAESDAGRERITDRQIALNRLAAKGAGRNDNYSWILLDPEQLRLQSAEFKNPKSRNLLAGTAAGAVGIASADAEEKARGGILRKVSKHV